MKYSDEQITANVNLLSIAGSMTNRALCRSEEHPVASYCKDAAEIIEQLRAELAKERIDCTKWSGMAFQSAQQHDALRADIERKRARIAALVPPDHLALMQQGRADCANCALIARVLATLDDKETHHA